MLTRQRAPLPLAQASIGLLALLSIDASQVSAEPGAQELATGVTVGGQAVSALELRDGVRFCKAQAKPRSAGGAALPEDAAQKTASEMTGKTPATQVSALALCLKERSGFKWLLARDLREKKLSELGPAHRLSRRILAEQLLSEMATRIEAPTSEELEARRKSHFRDFERGTRLRIARILVPTLEKAKEIQSRLHKDLTPNEFRALCRTESIDTATKERGGDLGFVAADGSTDVPELRVRPELYQAALTVSEGEFVKEPVKEGDHYAILWHRGSLGPEQMPESQQLALVKESFYRETLDAQKLALLKTLRDKYLRRHAPERAAALKLPAPP